MDSTATRIDVSSQVRAIEDRGVLGAGFVPDCEGMAHMTTDNRSTGLDDADTRLLDAVQRGVPLEPRPFAALGEAVGIGEDDCVRRLGELRGPHGVIRQISAIFDTQALGYESSLVCARYVPARLEAAARIVCQHPGVSHCYQRDHMFNLWYTLAIPPDSRLGLDQTIARLHETSGAAVTRALPTVRLFKIGVRFDMNGEGAGREAEAGTFSEADRAEASRHTISQKDKQYIRVLQQDLPLEPQPFAEWAHQASSSVSELLSAANTFLQRRQMRRFSAVLRHRAAGFTANVMGVWRAPEDQIETCGKQLAAFDAVTHCYQRPTHNDWPYNLFTMVHARDPDQAVDLLKQMQKATGLDECLPLWTKREFKKVRVRYFDGETDAWEQRDAEMAARK